jgi:hypothetical protein
MVEELRAEKALAFTFLPNRELHFLSFLQNSPEPQQTLKTKIQLGIEVLLFDCC